MQNKIYKFSLLALLTLSYVAPALARSPLSSVYISDQNLTISPQGIFLLRNDGKRLVKYSDSTFDELDSVTLAHKARKIISNDTRVVVVTQNGNNVEFLLYNGTDLSLLGSTSFDRGDD